MTVGTVCRGRQLPPLELRNPFLEGRDQPIRGAQEDVHPVHHVLSPAVEFNGELLADCRHQVLMLKPGALVQPFFDSPLEVGTLVIQVGSGKRLSGRMTD